MSGATPRANRVVEACLLALFTILWSAGTLALLTLIFVLMPTEGLHGSQGSLLLHNLALLSPFVYTAILLAWFDVILFARVRGVDIAQVRKTLRGWEAEFPSRAAIIVSGAAFTGVVFATAFIPNVAMGKRNPSWVWAIAYPAGIALAWATYRGLYYRPVLDIDEIRRTVSIPIGRWTPKIIASWDAVAMVTVIRRDMEDSADRYDCVLTVQHGGESVAVPFHGHEDPAPVERFAAWLRERLGRGAAAMPTHDIEGAGCNCPGLLPSREPAM